MEFMLFRKKYLICSFFALLLGTLLFIHPVFYKPNSFTTCWGEQVELSDDLKTMINLPIMQRLKDVDQSGPARFFGPKLPKFSRYNHSLGVFAILKKNNASKKEQVAGIFHDASHTVFSHVGDYIFAKNISEFTENSYQDSIHMAYLRSAKLDKALAKIDIKFEEIDPENPEYKRLEQSLPDMCADRIEYNIHTGILLGMISKSEGKAIIDNIIFENGNWFFKDRKIARKFAELSLYFTQNFWGSKWNVALNIHLANALRRALELKIINKADLFLTDTVIMNKLAKNQDRIIQLNLMQCKQPLEKMKDMKYRTESFTPKFRGIDPLVLDNEKTVRLTAIDPEFKAHHDEIRDWCQKGFYVDILAEI